MVDFFGFGAGKVENIELRIEQDQGVSGYRTKSNITKVPSAQFKTGGNGRKYANEILMESLLHGMWPMDTDSAHGLFFYVLDEVAENKEEIGGKYTAGILSRGGYAKVQDAQIIDIDLRAQQFREFFSNTPWASDIRRFNQYEKQIQNSAFAANDLDVLVRMAENRLDPSDHPTPEYLESVNFAALLVHSALQFDKKFSGKSNGERLTLKNEKVIPYSILGKICMRLGDGQNAEMFYKLAWEGDINADDTSRDLAAAVLRTLGGLSHFDAEKTELLNVMANSYMKEGVFTREEINKIIR